MQFITKSIQLESTVFVDPPTGQLKSSLRVQFQNNSNPDITNVLVYFVPDTEVLTPPSYDLPTTTLKFYKHESEALLIIDLIYKSLNDTSGKTIHQIDYDEMLNRVNFVFGVSP